MKRSIMWFLLLNKRLYKKATFIAILLIIPIVIGAFSIVAKQESGIVRVALSSDNLLDTLTQEIILELKNSSKLLHFTEYDTPESAIESVKNGQNDSAWIFPDNLKENIDSFTLNNAQSNSIVKVYEREPNISLNLAREKLSGVIYKHASPMLYLNHCSGISELSSLTDKELMSYYNSVKANSGLFEFTYLDEDTTNFQNSSSYLISPIRGFLSIIVIICGLASAILFLQDEKRGTFAWVKQSSRIFVSIAYQFIAILNASVVMQISLFAIGVNMSLLHELLALAIFIICSTLFCTLLQQLFYSIKLLSIIIPTISVVLVAVCPIVFDFKALKPLQQLFPPTHYLSSLLNNNSIIISIVYLICLFLLTILVEKIREKTTH